MSTSCASKRSEQASRTLTCRYTCASFQLQRAASVPVNPIIESIVGEAQSKPASMGHAYAHNVSSQEPGSVCMRRSCDDVTLLTLLIRDDHRAREREGAGEGEGGGEESRREGP